MRVLLVEPEYRKTKLSKQNKHDDSALWYPPLGLMKLARFHKDRGDEVKFVRGFDLTVFSEKDLFSPAVLWDRIYITTLFTFNFNKIVETINNYKEAVGGTLSKIFVGGIMASLMSEDIFNETGIYPIQGVLNSPESIRLLGDENIDLLPPDYNLLDSKLYAINDTYYAYTTRGCIQSCPWCGVPKIEPKYIPYIDIKPSILQLRMEYGDKANLCLMDNNILPSPHLKKIVEDLLELGYGRDQYTSTSPKKIRTIDFNQGLDATHLSDRNMKLLSNLNIRPMRIAFDRLKEKNQYIKAIKIAHKYGVPEFSNYMLFNFKDNPRDLYERIQINIDLNTSWMKETPGKSAGKIYSYPMRFAPINSTNGECQNRKRDISIDNISVKSRNWLTDPIWTKRFIRNIEIMKGAAYGAISPTPSLATRTIGSTFEDFLTNLYMPEEFLRNRNKHEKIVYPFEPYRKPGTGLIEDFRKFTLSLLKKQDDRFWEFHNPVSENSLPVIKSAINHTKDQEIKKWLKFYIRDKND